MRTPASGDRRAKVLKLTPEGRRIVEKAFSRHAAELESGMAVLNASEKRQLHVLLKKLGLFAAGVAASVDVVDAQVALLQAGLDRTQAIAAARLAEARLDRALGK